MSGLSAPPLACGLPGCVKSLPDEDALFWHRDLVHAGWDDDFTPEPPPAGLCERFTGDPRAKAAPAPAAETSVLALLSDRPAEWPRMTAGPHEHLEADGRFHPKHWCAWCGQNRGREPMKVVVHHATQADALKCIDEAACLRRSAARQRDAA